MVNVLTNKENLSARQKVKSQWTQQSEEQYIGLRQNMAHNVHIETKTNIQL